MCPSCGPCLLCERLESPALRLGKLLAEMNVPVLFGLQAQGHIPKIEEMLSKGLGWQEIGAAIHWDPVTAERHYRLHLEKRAAQ